jgi:hypothetical protein
MVKLSDRFPRYTDHDPLVPVWCVTPGEGRAIHRFFDTSPFSPSGRYLAVFRLPFEDRVPPPGEKGRVCVIDLENGDDRVVAETCGWETQVGANVNWGGDDHALFFNDVDTATWQPFAWRLDPFSGDRRRLEGPVYHASPDGRRLISANPTTMRKTQAGYGVVVPDDRVRRNVGPAGDDGFYLTDADTGESRLLVSIREALERADPPVELGDAERFEIYGFHSKFNPPGDRIAFSLRWFPARAEPRWRVHDRQPREVRYAYLTARPDGTAIHCAVGPEQWDKGGHHTTWFPDGRRLSMNLNLDGDGMRFVQVNEDGRDLRPMRGDVWGSGHPTVHPDGRHILTDTYTNEKMACGDGTIPLRWVDLADGRERALVRINTAQPCPDAALRVDPHPAWDRAARRIAFNAFVGGTRRVYVADLTELIERG